MNTQGKIRIKKTTIILVAVLAFIALNLTVYVGYKFLTIQKAIPASSSGRLIPSITPKITALGPEDPRSDLLRKVPDTATQKEKDAQEQLLLKNRRDTGLIFIEADCITNPPVANLVNTKVLKISNEDDVAHTIVFTKEKSYVIQPKAYISIPLTDFSKNHFYPYLCDNKTDIDGYMYISQ
ncbi:MAG TPA: hypothetical protein VG935_03855 [Patescibacteria group bacterium]|nr:hypothetical protein [Patescibacteria group bacterium]